MLEARIMLILPTVNLRMDFIVFRIAPKNVKTAELKGQKKNTMNIIVPRVSQQ